MASHVHIKRIYEMPDDEDGYRMLVDRLWPRGVRKAEANLDEWNKTIAPSTELRKWFDHREERFADFSERYRHELLQNGDELTRLRKIAGKDRLTLLYGAKSEKINHAVVLQQVLKAKK